MSIVAPLLVAWLSQEAPVPVQSVPVLEAPQATAEVGGKPYVEIYDIRDLLPSYRSGRHKVEDAAPATSDAATSSGAAPAVRSGAGDRAPERGKVPVLSDLPLLSNLFTDRSDRDEDDADCRTVLRTLMQCFGAHLDDGLTCEVNEAGAMALSARAATHRRVADFLLALRTDHAPQLNVDVAIYELDGADRAALEKYVHEHGGSAPEGGVASQVDPKLFLEFIQRRRTNQLSTPNIITRPLEPYAMTAGSSISYVAGHDQVVIEGIGTIADPVIKQLFEGIELGGVGVAMESIGTMRAPYALKLQTRMTVLKRPIDTVKSDAGMVQLPETRHTEFGTTIAGFLGSPVIVGGVPRPGFDGKDDVRLYLMVTVKAIAIR